MDGAWLSSPRSYSLGKCPEDGLPGHHAATHILSRPGCWDPSVIPTGAKWALENGSASLKRVHASLVLRSCALGALLGASEAQKGDLVPAPCGLVLGAFLGRDPLSLTHRIHLHQRSAGVRLDWKVTHSPQRTSLSSEEGVQHRPLTSVSPRLQWKPWHLSGCDAPKVEFSKEELPGVFIFPG